MSNNTISNREEAIEYFSNVANYLNMDITSIPGYFELSYKYKFNLGNDFANIVSDVPYEFIYENRSYWYPVTHLVSSISNTPENDEGFKLFMEADRKKRKIAKLLLENVELFPKTIDRLIEPSLLSTSTKQDITWDHLWKLMSKEMSKNL